MFVGGKFPTDFSLGYDWALVIFGLKVEMTVRSCPSAPKSLENPISTTTLTTLDKNCGEVTRVVI